MALALAAEAPRTVTVLGATGSIGRSTLDLVGAAPGRYRIEALTAHGDVDGLAALARRYGARQAVIADPGRYRALEAALSGSGIEAAAGPQALCEAAGRAEWVMSAIVGAAGLAPTLEALARGAIVALANKECLVSAGALFMRACEAGGATLLPVDSEHNAIFQALHGEDPDAVERIVLTASGGPFRDVSMAAMATATPEQARAHPNWDMGVKISIDSATMMNKGLELIEAHHLFQLPEERIEVLVHPQSVVHGMVAFRDGSMLAQLGTPDMRIPIAHTLGWPRRIAAHGRRLDLAALGGLSFEPPDPVRFPALRLAREALRSGGAAPTILNAANEIAVEAFVAGRIGFLAIAELVQETLATSSLPPIRSLDDVLACDAQARRAARELVRRRAGRGPAPRHAGRGPAPHHAGRGPAPRHAGRGPAPQ